MVVYNKAHFTHEPRAVTTRLWEPKRKCLKAAIATHLHDHVVWSQILKCSVKSHVTGPSTTCYFNDFWFTWILTHDKIEYIIRCERLECHGLPVSCQAYLQKVVFENNPSDHETWSMRCHVGIHVDFTSIMHSHTLSVPQAQCEANLDRLHLSHQWSVRVTGSQSRVWSGSLSLSCDVSGSSGTRGPSDCAADVAYSCALLSATSAVRNMGASKSSPASSDTILTYSHT